MKIIAIVFMMLALPLVFANSKYPKYGEQLLQNLEKRDQDHCNVTFERIGCYKDTTRPLNDYILSDRDPSLSIYSGISIDWHNFDTYLPDFACRCAQKAVQKGYDTFGLQYYGECWSGKEAEVNYMRDGSSTNCANESYKTCQGDKFCVGKRRTNFVYRIKCPVKFERIGCYKDTTRPLNDYILTDRDSSRSIYSGIPIDWKNFGTYLPDFACRCAQKAKQKGYDTFGLQYYGECWSGEHADRSYTRDGRSTSCVNKYYKTCDNNQFCVGKEHTNYVYRIKTDNLKAVRK